eukprot:3592888-Pyramimonas_sp.AAC.1
MWGGRRPPGLAEARTGDKLLVQLDGWNRTASRRALFTPNLRHTKNAQTASGGLFLGLRRGR